MADPTLDRSRRLRACFGQSCGDVGRTKAAGEPFSGALTGGDGQWHLRRWSAGLVVQHRNRNGQLAAVDSSGRYCARPGSSWTRQEGGWRVARSRAEAEGECEEGHSSSGKATTV